MGIPQGLVRLIAAASVVSLIAGCGDDDTSAIGSSPEPTEAASDEGGPELGEHWHVAIEFSECGEPLPVLEDDAGPPHSLHSHSDGLIHIHPSTMAATGENATLGVFLDTVGATVTDDRIETVKWSLPFSGECGGEAAHLVLVEWDSAGERTGAPTVVESAEQLRSIRLDEDGAALAISLVVDPNDVRYPSSAASLERPVDVASLPAVGQGTPVDAAHAFTAAAVLGKGPAPCTETATPDRPGATCFELAPAVIGPDVVASARATPEHEGGDLWAITVHLTSAGSKELNTIAPECTRGTPRCPAGQLALVIFGEVVTAPLVHASEFSSELVITGRWSEQEARELADAISP